MDSLRNFMIGGIAVIGGYLMNRGSYSAETFESPYAGAGALMDITKDTSLGDFSKQELTESSAIHGDFDHASLNYSGHQNIQARAEAESKDYEKAYNRLRDALYDDWVYRDIEDSCNCEYIVDQKLESGEITMEEAESDTPQCQYCVVMDVFNEYGAETFNSYKVAPELSSYTKDELISSKAGPQGTATYDEMEYDPIAQDRLSAEELFPPYTYDYSDEVKARVLNKILLWHENMQLQSEGIADRMDRILWMLDNPDKYWEDWDLHAKDMGYEGHEDDADFRRRVLGGGDLPEEFRVHEEER